MQPTRDAQAAPKAGSVSERVVQARTRDPKATLSQIGKRAGCSKQWAEQVLNRFGLPSKSRSNTPIPRACRECGEPTAGPNRKFCNKKCIEEHHWTTVECDQCGGEYRVRKGNLRATGVKGYKNRFCNRKCMAEYFSNRSKPKLSEMKEEERPDRGYPMSRAGTEMAQVQRAQKVSRSCREGKHRRVGCRPQDHCCHAEAKATREVVREITAPWKGTAGVRIFEYPDGSIGAMRCGAKEGERMARTLRYPRDREQAMRILDGTGERANGKEVSAQA